jgi:hypothetical protein
VGAPVPIANTLDRKTFRNFWLSANISAWGREFTVATTLASKLLTQRITPPSSGQLTTSLFEKPDDIVYTFLIPLQWINSTCQRNSPIPLPTLSIPGTDFAEVRPARAFMISRLNGYL